MSRQLVAYMATSGAQFLNLQFYTRQSVIYVVCYAENK